MPAIALTVPGTLPGASAAEITLMRQACRMFRQRFEGPGAPAGRPGVGSCLAPDPDSHLGALALPFFPPAPDGRAGWVKCPSGDGNHLCVSRSPADDC